MPDAKTAAAELPPLLEEYRKHLALERGLAINTCKAYTSDLKIFFKLLGAKNPLKVSASDLSDYLWELKSNRNYKPTTLFRVMEALRSFYKFQASEERISEDPTRQFKAPHMPERLPRYLARHEVENLIRAASQASASRRFEAVRLHAMLEALYATGMRVSEILTIKPQDCNFQEGWIRVLGKGSKERMVPINPKALAALTRYLKVKEEKFAKREAAPAVFVNRNGRALSRVQFWRDLKSLGKRCGLGQRLHPHLLRHSFASHLIQGGADLRVIQEMLGHANLTTTQVYTHLEPGNLKASHRKHHPRG